MTELESAFLKAAMNEIILQRDDRKKDRMISYIKWSSTYLDHKLIGGEPITPEQVTTYLEHMRKGREEKPDKYGKLRRLDEIYKIKQMPYEDDK